MPLAFGGLKAWISCDGKMLPEYQVEVENNRLTCYVPSEVGNFKTFTVHYASDGYTGDTYSRIFVDGVEADGGCDRSSQLQKGTSTFRGIHRDNTLRPFVFAPVQTNDHDASPARDLSQLGTLELKICRTVIVLSTNDPYLGTPEFQTFDPISERTKLAGSHCTTLGAPVQAKIVRRLKHVPLDADDNPHVVFCFRYLPRELLQARGILPTDQKGKAKAKQDQQPEKKDKKRAEPASKGADRSTKRQRAAETSSPLSATQVKEEAAEGSHSGQASLSDAERIRLLEQALKSSQDALVNIQAELQNLKSKHAGPSSTCKAERPPSPIRLGLHNGDVIDLTED